MVRVVPAAVSAVAAAAQACDRRTNNTYGGGIAGEQFDPCYHEACDTLDNVDLHALEVNSDLFAFAQLTFAYSTESVNGVPGKKAPGPPVNLPHRPVTIRWLAAAAAVAG